MNTALVGRYAVDREIGAGGMATVYLARDLRHDRLVALKVLRPELGAVLGLERFLSEIKVTANLQHPNLLPLFDSGEANGLLFYVMPYVDGETLRARLEREKQLPVDEVVRIAVAIANALDYAHTHNVIHRDLKPENILLQAGQPVIADFGIALAVSNAGGSRITQTGLSLGTPQYMSPEQATGDRIVDGRSDIYSLAAVTYEMLTGEAPHTGNTAQAIIARLLTDKPRSIRSTRASVPEHVESTIEHALEKLPADRFSTAREFADSLLGRSTPSTARTAALATAVSRAAWRARLRDPLVVGLAAAVVALSAFAAVRGGSVAASSVLAPVRFVITLPDSVRLDVGTPWPGAASPDGSAFVFSASTGGAVPGLWIRRTDQLEPRPIPGTQGGGQVIFSPDGNWISYQTGAKTFKVRLDGSAPVAVSSANSFNGADWTKKDVLVFGTEKAIHGLSTVSAAGGDLTPLTRPDSAAGELDHLWPVVAPDGNTVVFAIWRGALVTSQLAVTRIDDSRVTKLDIKAIRPLAIVDGQLVYVQADGAVLSVPFDAGKQRVTGRPVPVHDPVQVTATNNGNSGINIGKGGALLTMAGGSVNQLAWLSRAGAPTLISSERRDFSEPRLSPDGQKIAVTIADGANSAIWVFDLRTSTMSKLTNTERASSPTWLPGGHGLAYFGLDGEGRPALFTQSVDGGSAPQRISGVSRTGTGLTVSPDGRTFLYSEIRSSSWDIMQVTVDANNAATVKPYLATLPFEANPQFSPDGRWVSMSSAESERLEVVVRSFPDPRVRVQVSVNGGAEPRWSRDGTHLLYRAGERLISARVTSSGGFLVLGRDTLPAAPQLTLGGGLTTNYDVSPDGNRLLVLSSGRTFLQLVAAPNWLTELRARASAGAGK